ncbi:MAG: hypothetical protein WCT35_00490 [Sideroxydans sp.]|jgi:hypothetical protein
MKKISVAIVMLLSVFSTSSAIAEDSLFAKAMGGEKSASGYTREEMIMGMVDFGDTTTTGTIFLSEGIYINPKTVLSMNLMETISSTTIGTATSTSMLMMLGVGAKQYLGEPAKSATVPYVLGSAGFIMMLSSYDSPTIYTSSTDTGFSFQGGGGIAHFMTEAVSIDGTLQYYSNSIAGFTTSGVRLNAGITARY